jgi:plasmid stabilization system protein ParE
MKLRFSPRAMQDLVEIADYIRERNPAASLRVRAAIIDSLQTLILFPDIGRLWSRTSRRALPFAPTVAPARSKGWPRSFRVCL